MRPPASIRGVHRGQPYTLRAPRPADARALVQAVNASLPELRAFMPWAHLEHTVDSQYARLVDVQADFWAARDMVFHLWGPLRPGGSEALLGCYGLHRRTLNPKALEVGYWTRSEVAGQGLCTFAARALVVLCFEHLGCERVQCAHNASNIGSQRVCEKVGFVIEGHMPYFEAQPTDQMVADGAVRDPGMVMRSLVRAHIPDLPWYAGMAASLEVVDWEGRR